MVTKRIHAVHGVNHYLWSRIEAEGILSRSNYNGVRPIVPVQETPEILQIIESQPGIASHPYIVYNWTRSPGGVNWFVKTDLAAYSIRSADDVKIRQLINLFDEEFSDYDRAAQRVNAYISNMASETNMSDLQDYLAFDYKEIHVAGAGGQLPVERENDENEAIFTLSIMFSAPPKY